jgi:hypothetical protein
MNDAHEGDLVTPRARSLTLQLAEDLGVRYKVERGDALRFVRRRPDGQFEVDYLQRRWVAPGEALQLLAHLLDNVTMQSEGSPASAPAAKAPLGDPDSASMQPAELLAPGEPEASSRRQVGVGWRLALGGAALVALVALALLLARRLEVDEESLPSEQAIPSLEDGRATTQAAAPAVPVAPAATPSATPRASVAPPVVSNFVVCDTTVDCGIAEGEFSRAEVLACLRVMPGGSGAPLVLVATAGEDPPAGAQSAVVLARSGPVPQDPSFRCHPVRSTGGELADGRYWLWALDGSTTLGRVQFVVGRP